MSRLSFREACDLVPDDLPDGAYWAMAHEMAGLEYGDGFAELLDDQFVDEARKAKNATKAAKPHKCRVCGKRFRTKAAKSQHGRDAHPAPPEG